MARLINSLFRRRRHTANSSAARIEGCWNQGRFGRSLSVWLWPVALGLAAWVISQLPVGSLRQAVGALTLGQWLAWFTANLLVIVVAVLRWRVFTRLLHLPVGFGALLKIRQAGQTVSIVTPGPQLGGEPLQIYWLRNQGAPVSAALLSLGLDRCYELAVNFSVLVFGVALLAWSPLVDSVKWPRAIISLASVPLLVAMAGLVLWRNPQHLSGRLEDWRRHRLLQTLIRLCQGLAADFGRIRSAGPKAFTRALSLSLLGWGALLAELWLLLDFIGGPPGLSAFLLVFVAIRLAFLLPLPGGIGSLEAALFWAFDHMHAAPETAVSLILLMRLRDVVLLVFGGGCLLAMGSNRHVNLDQS